MILDKQLTYQQKVWIAVVSASVWIYFRDFSCYKLLPRKSILAVAGVALWTYYNYSEPLLLPIGLFIMFFFRG